jgi:hypothetical protein
LENKLSSLRPKTSKFSFAKSKPKSTTTSTSQPIKHESTVSQPPAGPSSSTNIKKDIPGNVIRFENLKQSVIRLDPSHTDISSTVILKNLDKCIIDLRPPSSNKNIHSRARITSLHGEGLTYCTLIAPVDGSILLHSLTSCILIISCHQVSSPFIMTVDVAVPNARFYDLFCSDTSIFNANH